jgi:hypothetical protein
MPKNISSACCLMKRWGAVGVTIGAVGGLGVGGPVAGGGASVRGSAMIVELM